MHKKSKTCKALLSSLTYKCRDNCSEKIKKITMIFTNIGYLDLHIVLKFNHFSVSYNVTCKFIMLRAEDIVIRNNSFVQMFISAELRCPVLVKINNVMRFTLEKKIHLYTNNKHSVGQLFSSTFLRKYILKRNT